MHSIVHISHFNHFLLYRWSCDGLLTVSREDVRDYNELMPFMSYKDRSPFVINYIGFSTAWGATGEWIIEGTLTLVFSKLTILDL